MFQFDDVIMYIQFDEQSVVSEIHNQTLQLFLFSDDLTSEISNAVGLVQNYHISNRDTICYELIVA